MGLWGKVGEKKKGKANVRAERPRLECVYGSLPQCEHHCQRYHRPFAARTPDQNQGSDEHIGWLAVVLCLPLSLILAGDGGGGRGEQRHLRLAQLALICELKR